MDRRSRNLPSLATTATCIFVVREFPGRLRSGLTVVPAALTAWLRILLMSARLNPDPPDAAALLVADGTRNVARDAARANITLANISLGLPGLNIEISLSNNCAAT